VLFFLGNICEKGLEKIRPAYQDCMERVAKGEDVVQKRVGNTMNPGTWKLTSFALWVPVLTRPAAYCPVREDEVGQTPAAGVSQDERPPS
jgi:hypothetical protein